MVNQTRVKFVDLNLLLMASNLMVLLLSLWALISVQGNLYVDKETFALGIILCIQTHVALLVEKNRRDPLVILLAYTITFYYSLRILTLALYPFSVVFERFPSSISPDTLNHSILYIIIANVFLYAGFFAKRFNSNRVVQAGHWRATSTSRTIFLLFAVIVIAYTRASYWNAGSVDRAFIFLTIFISQSTIIMMVIGYLFLYHKSMSRMPFMILAGLVLSEMVVHMLTGSRAAILSLVQAMLLANLAIYGCVKFRLSHIKVGLVALPLIAILLVASFSASSYIRAHKEEGNAFEMARAVELGVEWLESDSGQQTTSASQLPVLFDRLGFLDYSTEIMANSERYAAVVNFPAYIKSIIDNLLTPGFDIFDQARISYALQWVYNPSLSGDPLKSEVEQHYQSDQLGLYGELYTLFGEYWSIPVFFIITFMLKWVYVSLSSPNPVILVFKRNAVFIAFFMIINSYGFDWMLIEITPIVASIFLFKFFFPSVRVQKVAL